MKYDAARTSLSFSICLASATTSVMGPSVVRLLTGLTIIGFFDNAITGFTFPEIVSISIWAVFWPVVNISTCG